MSTNGEAHHIMFRQGTYHMCVFSVWVNVQVELHVKANHIKFLGS